MVETSRGREQPNEAQQTRTQDNGNDDNDEVEDVEKNGLVKRTEQKESKMELLYGR